MGERVSAFVDGEVSEMERVAVRRHLEGCTSCRDFVAFSRRAQRTIRRGGLPARPAAVSPARLSSAARGGRSAPGRLHRTVLGLAAALLVGVFTGVIGMEVAFRDTDSGSASFVQYEAKTASRPMSLFARYFEIPPKPPMVFPVIRVIEPLPPDPSFRWAGLESGESYPEGYRVELVSY
jgi:hypothetical protein